MNEFTLMVYEFDYESSRQFVDDYIVGGLIQELNEWLPVEFAASKDGVFLKNGVDSETAGKAAAFIEGYMRGSDGF